MNLETQKHKLEVELKKLEIEIAEIAEKQTDSTWETKQTETEDGPADREDIADSIESYTSNLPITSDIEKEIIEIKDAIDKIISGTYGKCEVCGKQIEEDRLEANPQARNCELHM